MTDERIKELAHYANGGMQSETVIRAAINEAFEEAAKAAETCHDFGPDTTDPQRAYFLGLADAAKKIRALISE